ncbi:DUF2922 domain-containing protein [Mesobacillus zeae]|uniref:DUF2922 domain-containing protein n=1 Tax=Mesobacillus zeae TaxID=1917180 RepID=A0A398B0Q2_9BACI|nr:DUF2922 domain-containing protein [Mesobacillus zeae]RID81463.1 DUF2922 domain-containing protein [Mesobacillus zeae]
MAKTLELQFVTDLGKAARITVDNPKEPINPAAVKLAMDQIIASDAFLTGNGILMSASGARLIERNVTEYEMA